MSCSRSSTGTNSYLAAEVQQGNHLGREQPMSQEEEGVFRPA